MLWPALGRNECIGKITNGIPQSGLVKVNYGSVPQKVVHECDDTEMAQLRAAVEESGAAERRGEVVSHDQVRTWLLALAAHVSYLRGLFDLPLH